MDQNFSNYYKLQIAHALIMFLINLQVNGLSQDLQAERTNMILDAWEKRLDVKLKELQEANLKSIAEAEGFDLDVAKILADIQLIEPEAIRKEFKIEVRHKVFRSFGMEK
jgi:hypothetical protein